MDNFAQKTTVFNYAGVSGIFKFSINTGNISLKALPFLHNVIHGYRSVSCSCL